MVKRKLKQSEMGAIKDLQKKIRSARNHGKMQEAAEYSNQLGNQYRLLEMFEEAIDAHQEEINISKNYLKNDKMALGLAYRNMGEVLTEMNNGREAIRYINLYMKIAKDTGSLIEEQRAYITLGRLYLCTSENEEESEEDQTSGNRISAIEKAFQSFKNAYRLLTKDELRAQVKDEKELMLMKCNNAQNLGITLELQGKFADATSWLTKATDIANKYQFQEVLAPCYTLLCALHIRDGKLKDALSDAKNSTKAAKALGNQSLEVESQLLEAKALFLNDEVDVGKRILKRLRQRIRKKQELHQYLEDLDPLLTAAVRITRTLDTLNSYNETDEFKNQSTKLTLHEVLGDNYATLTNYQVSLVQYKKAAQYAESLGFKGKKLSRLYYSIAETYRDLENYGSALKYYHKEMLLHSGNPAEEFKTQTSITDILERLKKPAEEVIEAHELAVSLAKMTKNAFKVVTALNNFCLYLKSVGRIEEAEKKKEKADQIKSKNHIDLEEPESDSQELLDENDAIDLDNLSDEEDSDDEEDDNKKTVKKKIGVRVNEAGESQLHIAAKKGDLKLVCRLIRQGHPVHTRDHAGWTPLHEACNFGRADVVEELLKHNALVNDAGGALADKITPLHDAAYNGHTQVMKVLIKYKANVLARDREGKYPIDSLFYWLESEAGRESSELEKIAFEEVKELLKHHMEKAGKPYGAEDENRSRRRARVTINRDTSTNQSMLLVTKPFEKDCPIITKTVFDEYDPDEEGNGKESYKNAIKQVGRKLVEIGETRKEKARPISPGPRGALIPSEKDFHQNHKDWLDDEVLPSTSKQTLKPKRKRDSMEDIILDERSTRRKTGRSSHSRRNYDDDDGAEIVSASIRVRDADSNEEDDSELMDINSQTTDSPRRSDSPQVTNRNDGILSYQFDEEDFGELLDNDFGLGDLPQDNEDFLPSQRPTRSTVEFGKTVDVPIVEEDNHSDGGSPVSAFPGGKARRRSPTKRQRTVIVSSDEEDSLETSRNRTKLSEIPTRLRQVNNNSKFLDKHPRKERSLVQSKLPVAIVPRTSYKSDSEDANNSPPFVRNTLRSRTISSSSLQTSIDDRQKNEVLRLHIHVLDKILLVPVEEKYINESIDWLAKESATRYLQCYGVKPILTLQTKDGASLSGADPISLVLGANERELKGIVANFDLPPLVERYSSACSKEGIQVNPEIKSCLDSCQSSNILNLCDACVRGQSAVVLMTALQRQTSLRVLVLAGCSLFDPGLLELCKVLPTLSGLTEVDISSNGITKTGFMAFANVFLQPSRANDSTSSFSSTPFGLTSLVLSHNPLGNQIGTALAELLTKLSSLRRLEVSDCDLSEKLFAGGKNELVKALNNSRLEEVDISYNAFKDMGLDKFLQNLPARRISSLNCSSCAPSSSNSTHDVVAKAVAAFLSRNEDCCNLRKLQLNDCGFNDKSVDTLIDNFDRLVRLENLELACNDLTVLSFVNILGRSVEREIPLTKLDFGSMPSFWDTTRVNKEEILLAITKKMSSQKKLSELRVPISADDGKFKNDNNELIMSGSQIYLSELEQNMVNEMSDCAGYNKNFIYEKQGSCMIYRFED